MTHITAVAPVHNEEGNIDELVSRLAAALGSISPDYRIVLVDDGSRDATWARLEAAARREPRLAALRFSRNFGQHTAITAGLDHADSDWTVVLDGDLQDRPEVIPDLYAEAIKGYDIVFVERQRRPEGALYQALQRMFYWMLRKLTGGQYDATHGNFSIIARRVLTEYKRLGERARFYGGLIEWLGFTRSSVKARHGERHSGRPSYNFLKRLTFAKQIILSFTTRPLDLTLGLGLAITVTAFAFGLYVLLRALFFGYPIEGWASLMVSIYFLGGVQMIMLGMVGLYVGRVSEEIRRRPAYVVADRIEPRAGHGAEAAE